MRLNQPVQICGWPRRLRRRIRKAMAARMMRLMDDAPTAPRMSQVPSFLGEPLGAGDGVGLEVGVELEVGVLLAGDFRVEDGVGERLALCG